MYEQLTLEFPPKSPAEEWEYEVNQRQAALFAQSALEQKRKAMGIVKNPGLVSLRAIAVGKSAGEIAGFIWCSRKDSI